MHQLHEYYVLVLLEVFSDYRLRVKGAVVYCNGREPSAIRLMHVYFVLNEVVYNSEALTFGYNSPYWSEC